MENPRLGDFDETMMHRVYFLMVTAFAEGGIGLLLLIWPFLPLALLLGVDHASSEVTICARIAGAALLALGVACWLGQFDKQQSAQFGLLSGILIYDLAAAVILAYAGLFVRLVGIALWPAVVLHAALAVWCVLCLSDKPSDENVATRAQLETAGRAKEGSG
jgi:uncharacterized membrane protein